MTKPLYVQTISGIRLPFLDPKPEHISIHDIAHALAMTCRFAGHVQRFYTVADHSVRVSRECRPEDARWALLHDAAEAYLPDLPSPMKACMPEYRELEARIHRAVLDHFGLPHETPPDVKRADLVLLATEARDLCSLGWEDWGLPYPPQPRRIRPIEDPPAAREVFLERFGELFPERCR